MIATRRSPRRPPWRRLGVAVALTSLGAAAACGEQVERTGQPVDVPATAETTTPATIPPTTLAPMQVASVAEWDGAPVSTVCVRAWEDYPQLADFHYPLTDWATQLLGPVGVTVVGPDDTCDATLTVVVTLEGLSAVYGTELATYYTGHRQDITVLLEAPERAAISDRYESEVLPGEYTSSDSPTTPQAYLESRAGETAGLLLRTIMRIWGPAVAVEALCLPMGEWPAPNFPFLAEQALIDAAGIRDTMLDAPSPNDYESWRHWVETGELVEGAGTGTCR